MENKTRRRLAAGSCHHSIPITAARCVWHTPHHCSPQRTY